ncbi:hypothetical protein ACQCSX_02450 [Pseudarthrobacter sp. P1]|uniref:hypothetical protein n=1 Tax=Pseudarthrobacter sp. P1 TaxID=3418418 RepID=UPI003CF66830
MDLPTVGHPDNAVHEQAVYDVVGLGGAVVGRVRHYFGLLQLKVLRTDQHGGPLAVHGDLNPLESVFSRRVCG